MTATEKQHTSLFAVVISIFFISSFFIFLPEREAAAAIPSLSGKQVFSYSAISSPVIASDSTDARPIAVYTNGDSLTIRAAIDSFSSPVDIYFGIYSPELNSDESYLLWGDGFLRPISSGLIPWIDGTNGDFDRKIVENAKISQIPRGKYTLYFAAVVPGSFDNYIIWQTELDLSQDSVVRSLASLKPVGGCDNLAEQLKERAIREMEEAIDDIVTSVKQYGCYVLYPPTDFSVGLPLPASAAQYSETNVQVPGVDEADFIKNDGSTIYIVANNKFKIISAWPPEQSHIISSVAVEGAPEKLFVAADKALIYSSLEALQNNSPYTYYNPNFFLDNECTYGYDCDFSGNGRKLKITIFDISDKMSPKLEREILFSGSYINSRRIGTAIHTVALFPPVMTPEVFYFPDDTSFCSKPGYEGIGSAFDALKEKNRRAIEKAAISSSLPSIKDIRYASGNAQTVENILGECQNFYQSARPEGQSFLTVLSLDLDSMADLNSSTVLGRPGAVYASSSSLYIASRQQYTPSFGWYYPVSEDTPKEAGIIHKFSLGNGPATAQYEASGVVKGRVLNQFSMDEYNGFLRIATTTGHPPDPGTHSTVSILSEDKGELTLSGQVDGIAPSEDIRSVRFYGDQGFLVTFKKTDPLFALDLSNPKAPKIAGELKIPGFSTYMQLMDNDHLLTIGYDASEQGGFALYDGLMLQVFDISDMSAPSLVQKEVIGTRGTASEAATDHLAFNYFAPKGMLAIPATICEASSGGSNYGLNMTFSGLLVYDVSIENGFNKRGGVSHVDPLSPNSPYMCYNFWADSNTVVKRSIFMDDYIYSVSEDLIKVDALNNIGVDISVIDLKN